MIPSEIVQKLIDFCGENELALAQLSIPNPNVIIVLLGPKQASIEQISVLAAHMLLSGVITGEYREGNNQAARSVLN